MLIPRGRGKQGANASLKVVSICDNGVDVADIMESRRAVEKQLSMKSDHH